MPFDSEKRVAILAGANMRRTEIATAIGISIEDLERYYAHALTVGRAMCVDEVVSRLYRDALNGDEHALEIIRVFNEENPDQYPLPWRRVKQ